MKPPKEEIAKFKCNNNYILSFKNPRFIDIINTKMNENDHIGYIAFIDVPIERKISLLSNIENELLIIAKGKLQKIHSEHKINGELLKMVFKKAFTSPIAIIKDDRLTETHSRPTINYVTKIANNNKNYYLIIEINAVAKNQPNIQGNIIKTIYDLKDWDKYLARIISKEKEGISLLYLE